MCLLWWLRFENAVSAPFVGAAIIVLKSEPEFERNRFSTSPTRERSFEPLSLLNVLHSLETVLLSVNDSSGPSNVNDSIADNETAFGADHVSSAVVLRQMSVRMILTSHLLTSSRCSRHSGKYASYSNSLIYLIFI